MISAARPPRALSSTSILPLPDNDKNGEIILLPVDVKRKLEICKYINGDTFVFNKTVVRYHSPKHDQDVPSYLTQSVHMERCPVKLCLFLRCHPLSAKASAVYRLRAAQSRCSGTS